MKASLIRITNILGISELTIKPGTVTEITGQNGQGKTSIIEAIRSIGVKGHDATLLRRGETEGRIVVELADGSEITKIIKADKTERKYKGPNGERGGATAVESIIDVLSINPVEFLTAEPKRQLEILLDSIDLDITDEELTKAAGFPARITGAALECIDTVYKSVFDERTGVNRAIREKKATLAQLGETVPTNIVEDPTAEIQRLQAEIAQHQGLRNEQIGAINNWKTSEMQRINDEAAAKSNAVNEACDSVTSTMQLTVYTLQEQLTQKGRFDQQKSVIVQMEAQLEELTKEEQAKSTALENLKALKTSKMDNLPFKGLAIINGEILLNGIPFQRINTSEQVKFAINLAVRRAGDLKLICVDGLEMIDPIRYEKFLDAVAAMDGYQFIVSRVSDEMLTVKAH